ncbi:MAG: EAL domain-containing protein [Firmicutes bacterium]|nr:EAL domain-containing protein [Bacillota bacterium]
MKKRLSMGKLNKVMLLIAVILIAAVIQTGQQIMAFADVSTTAEPTGDAGCVYIAGDPDGFPMEYYNEATHEYEGIMPDALKLVSEKTGLDFVYISAGTEDQRQRLLKNNQVQMITGYATVEFSDVASDKLKKRVTSALNGITDREWKELSQNYLYEGDRNTEPQWQRLLKRWHWALITPVVIILLICIAKERKKAFVAGMEDGTLRMGDENYFSYNFDKKIRENLRQIYYIFFISIDNDYVKHFFETDEFKEVLRHTAQIISDNMGKDDIIARISDGGFGVALQCSNREAAEDWADNLLSELSDFGGIVSTDKKPVVRCGICPASGHEADASGLLFTAHQCFLRAEKEEKLYVFQSGDLKREQEERRLLIKNTMSSIKNGEFRLYLQPVVLAETGEIAGAEALTRWEHPTQGLLPPSRYVALLQEIGTIGELDFFVFEEVCKNLAKWRGTPMEKMHISCNFTRMSIGTEDFDARIREIASRYSFDRSRLVIEITEDTMVKSAENAIKNIEAILEEGFSCCLDDFGSGYTSFTDLRDYPFNLVKLDRDIILGTESESGRELINGLVALCHSMNKEVICEGVENKRQLEVIRQAGGDYVQGFYFYKALPVPEAEKIMAGIQSSP